MAITHSTKRPEKATSFQQSTASDSMGDSESLEINGFGHPPSLKKTISMPLIYSDNPAGSMSADHDAHVDKAKLHQQGIITVNSLSFLPGASTRLPTATIPSAIMSLSIPATAPSPSSSSPPTQANIPAQQPSSGGVTSAPALRTLNPAARPETLRAALLVGHEAWQMNPAPTAQGI